MAFEHGDRELPWLHRRAVIDPNGRQFEIRAVANGAELRRVRSTTQVAEFLVEGLMTVLKNAYRFARGVRRPQGGFSVGVVDVSALEERVVDQRWVSDEPDVEEAVADSVLRVEAGAYSSR